MTTSSRIVAFLGFCVLLQAKPSLAAHASILNAVEMKKSVSLLQKVRTVRHFCAPCADTAWQEERIRRVDPSKHGPSDEWSILLNDKPVDVAYLYIPSGRNWRNLADLAGISYPDIPPQLDSMALYSNTKQSELLGDNLTWAGVYEFEDWAQYGSTGNRSTTLYTLTLFDTDSLASARFHADGLETFHRMQVAIVPEGENLHIVLENYLRENYGEPFAPGDTLFTLRRQAGGESATEWKRLRPSRPEPGQSFKRIRLNPLQFAD